MLLKIKPYIIALGACFITATALAQSGQDSTDLPKMQESDFKAMEPINTPAVLTKGNLKETFKGMQATVDNSGKYSAYHGDLLFKVIEQSGSLAIQKYTPKRDCSSLVLRYGRNLCLADNRKYAGATTVVCVIPQDAKSCKNSKGSYYELTMSGLLMGESYITCWYLPQPISTTQCGNRVHSQEVYMWDAPLVAK